MTFMRIASLAAVRGYVDLRAGEQAQALLAVREKPMELHEAVEKLSRVLARPDRVS